MSDTGIDPSAHVDPNAHVGPGCHVGPGSAIASGAFLQGEVHLGAEVTVAPNAVFTSRSFAEDAASPPTVVGDGVSVGANATVLAGVTIDRHAVVGAGAVVTHDVPAYAVVAGNPARIIGYASSPASSAPDQVVASTLSDDDLPLTIGAAELRRLPSVVDLRGALSHGEVPSELPFAPRRFFLVYDVPTREVRGEHAHKELDELLICVNGEIAIAVDDGEHRGELVLDRPDVALRLPPMVWSRQYRYSPDAVLLVLASDPYDADDYIREYSEFLALLEARGRPGG
jgi:hypothetical protein